MAWTSLPYVEITQQIAVMHLQGDLKFAIVAAGRDYLVMVGCC